MIREGQHDRRNAQEQSAKKDRGAAATSPAAEAFPGVRRSCPNRLAIEEALKIIPSSPAEA